MIHPEGLERVAQLIHGGHPSAPLVLHLVYSGDFPSYSPVPLDSAKWYVDEEGWFVQDAIPFAMLTKGSVSVTGSFVAFADGTKLYSASFDNEPRKLYFKDDAVLITPRYRLTEVEQ